MTDRDTLAALLHDLGIGMHDESDSGCEVSLHEDDAARLIAAGVRVAPSPETPVDTMENPYAESDARAQKFSDLAERAMQLMAENAALRAALATKENKRSKS